MRGYPMPQTSGSRIVETDGGSLARPPTITSTESRVSANYRAQGILVTDGTTAIPSVVEARGEPARPDKPCWLATIGRQAAAGGLPEVAPILLLGTTHTGHRHRLSLLRLEPCGDKGFVLDLHGAGSARQQ